MSSKSMGTLSLNLVANTGSFKEGTTRNMGRKVDLNFNFSAMDNGQLMELLMENRGALAGMVSSAFEDQGIMLG